MHDPSSRPAHRSQHLFSREGLFCAGLLLVCLLLAWPVANVGINDDWVYTLTTFDLARTGHFIFHGWASPLLGWQAIWGALIVRLFGASFTAVRLSMLPIALATSLIYTASLRRFGLNRAHAVFGTLLLTLGPVFLPLSATFMTDVPSLFAILLCIYLCQLAVDAATMSRAILWLIAAGVSNILFGTVRQIAWLGVLVIVPSCGWLLRKRRGVPYVTAGLWLLGVACIRFALRWFANQPYTAPERLIPGPLYPHLLVHGAREFILAVTTLCLLLLPVSVGAFSLIWPLRGLRALRGAAIAAAYLALVLILHAKGLAHIIQFPWLGNIMDIHGIMQTNSGMVGSLRTIPSPILLLLAGVVLLATWAAAEAFLEYRHRRIIADRVAPEPAAMREAAVLLLPYLIVYCVLLVPRAVFVVLIDRYLLGVMPVLLVFILHWHQRNFSARIPALSVAVLVLAGVISTAGTHDLFSVNRADVAAAEELMRAGIPRTQIRGGFAFDSTSQVLAQGHINDPRILNPPGTYKWQPDALITYANGPCGYPLLPFVPALNIHYVIAADPSPCLIPTGFPSQPYRTWLPPARRQLFIAQPVQPQPEATH